MSDGSSSFTPTGSPRWLVQTTLVRAASTVGIRPHGLETIELSDGEIATAEQLAKAFELAGKHVGLQVVQASLQDAAELRELLRAGMTAIILTGNSRSLLIQSAKRSSFGACLIENGIVQTVRIGRRELQGLVSEAGSTVLAVKPLQDCDVISSHPVFEQTGHSDGDHHHLTPLQRFIGMLRMDRRDIFVIAVFAVVAGILSLATPLAVETLVNVVSWGIYTQPLILLAVVLLLSLVFSAMFNVMQYVVVEIVQRRQFVRIVSDLSHRFPNANRAAIQAEHPRELANRVFDIMTIQKATAVLLLDGITIVLVTVMGLALLGFYHTYLLGLVIALMIAMTLITWLLGRGGVRTAIEESKTKYLMVHWLQDVLSFPTAFRVNGGDLLAIDRTSSIATKYVHARKQHFAVLLRQIIFATGLQSVALTSVLGVGGWLVMQGDMNLGQLVAAELVVTLVVGTFSKAGKSIEKFYDLMAGLDKVGHLIDLQADKNERMQFDGDGPLRLEWDDLNLNYGTQSIAVPAAEVPAGSLTAIVTVEPTTIAADALTGMLPPVSGKITVDHLDVRFVCTGSQQGRMIGLASQPEIFHGSIASNIDLGRDFVSLNRVRDVLRELGLWAVVSQLPGGLNSNLQSTGFPLSPTEQCKLMLARTVVANPRLIVVDRLLDTMSEPDQRLLMEYFKRLQSRCTMVLVTNRRHLAEQCDQRIYWSHA